MNERDAAEEERKQKEAEEAGLHSALNAGSSGLAT